MAKNFVQRLQEATRSWQKMCAPMLKHRRRMLEQYASGYYRGSNKNQPMNLIDRGVSILLPYLVMTNPKVMVKAKDSRLKPFGYTMELALNHWIREADFAFHTMRPAVLNALFGMGIVKTGIMHKDEVEIGGYMHDVGQPYADPIDDEDYVGDVSARTREQFEFEGHRYRLPTEYAKEFFGSKYADSIVPDYSLHGRGEKVESISKSAISSSELSTLREYTEFYDIWLPDEQNIITILPEGKSSRILRTVEWDGRESGPFDVLSFKNMPGTPVGIPPVYSWVDLNTVVNTLGRKVRNQTERAKNILTYESGSARDAERMTKAKDGQSVKVNDINRVKGVELGGVNEQIFDWMSYFENQFSIQGGNLYMMGGRQSEAGTLGQEKMLQTNAERYVNDMLNQTYRFAQNIINKLAWILWTDPFIYIPAVKKIAGVTDIPVHYSEEAREGDFLDYNLDIVPYSMSRATPEMEYQKMLQYLSQWLLPSAPLAAQQGQQLNVSEISHRLARYANIENAQDLWLNQSAEPERPNPYQPLQGSGGEKKGVADGRTGLQGAASRDANLRQQQNRTQEGRKENATSSQK